MKPIAYIMMGLPLAGKSTWIENNTELLKNCKIVSADFHIMKSKNYDPNKTHELHEWAVKEVEKETYSHIENKTSFIMDAGGINNSYTLRIIDKLKENNNFQVVLVHVKTPLSVCIGRLKQRERQVPIDNIIEKASLEEKQFNRLKNIVDEVILVPYFKNEYTFVDMDGVIASLATLPKWEGKVDYVNSDIHAFRKPVLPVIKKLGDPSKVYILSASPTSMSTAHKNKWLDENFNVSNENRFFVNSMSNKLEMFKDLHRYMKVKPYQTMLIEDNHQIVSEGQSQGFNVIHVSQYLTDDY